MNDRKKWDPLHSLDHFASSRLKVKRAKHHIENLNGAITAFLSSDFYTVSIEKELESGNNFLCIDIKPAPFPFRDAALVIGDTFHNLRSALDIVYHGFVTNPTAWTRFPVFDTREQLENTLGGALERKQISSEVHDLILDGIKPYAAGNHALWGLHDMNILDKHQLLIPLLKLFRFEGIRLEDDKGSLITQRHPYIMDESQSYRIFSEGQITVEDKGHASAAVLFDFGTAFDGKAVVPTLLDIVEKVDSTIEAFAAI